MTNKEITKVIFNNSEISALYYGDVLIWKKGNGSQQFGDYDLCGVFTDDITDTRNSINIYYTDNTSENVPIPYNSETKEFKYTIKKPYKRITFVDYDYWKNITHIPNNNEATTMYNLFHGLRNLTSLNISNLDTSKATELYGMFDGCLSLTSLDLSNFDVSKVTTMESMFNSCYELATLVLSNFDVSNVTNMDDMFERCDKLTTVTGVFEGTKVNLDLHWSPLTNASAMVLINGLANVTSTKTIKFNSTTYNTLTPEQIAVATSKGWTVARVD